MSAGSVGGQATRPRGRPSFQIWCPRHLREQPPFSARAKKAQKITEYRDTAPLISKTIRNRKRDCAWGCAQGVDQDTTWENLQIEKHKSVQWPQRTPSWFGLFDLQRIALGNERGGWVLGDCQPPSTKDFIRRQSQKSESQRSVYKWSGNNKESAWNRGKFANINLDRMWWGLGYSPCARYRSEKRPRNEVSFRVPGNICFFALMGRKHDAEVEFTHSDSLLDISWRANEWS